MAVLVASRRASLIPSETFISHSLGYVPSDVADLEWFQSERGPSRQVFVFDSTHNVQVGRLIIRINIMARLLRTNGAYHILSL